ncbi:MAG: hypothetical protein HY907_22110 [Deltaproteobacteria bacterium]|nr:hypothetical protein [Deltaproteobacteria bacterium]
MSRDAEKNGTQPEGRARDARKTRNDRRRAGARLVSLAKLHLLETLRQTPRCLPWRSGRTLKDLERRSGLEGPPSPERAQLLAPLLELLIHEGLVQRRAGHYRLRPACAPRCPACGGNTFHEHPMNPPADGARPGDVIEYFCTTCGAWSGMRITDAPNTPPTPSL